MTAHNNENMNIWDLVCVTDPKDTKGAKLSGMNITSICPQSQRMAATNMFGPFGAGWGVRDEEWTQDTYGETTLCRYNALFWYKHNGDEVRSFPICGTIKVAYMTQGTSSYLKIDDEYAKKVATDALTKGLSYLGFNADVFLGKYDDNKYVEDLKNQNKQADGAKKDAQAFDKYMDLIKDATTRDALEIMWELPDFPKKNKEIVAVLTAKAEELLVNKAKELGE